MAWLTPITSDNHTFSHCSLQTFQGPTVRLMNAAAGWHDPIRPRVMFAIVGMTATGEATAHFALGATILGATLVRRTVSMTLATLSWGLYLGYIWGMKWALEVGMVNWFVRILTEVGVALTRPFTFLGQWIDRFKVIYWAITRDRWLWNLAKTIDNKYKDFINVDHATHHFKKAGSLAIAAFIIPYTGMKSPESALRKFGALHIVPADPSIARNRRYMKRFAVLAGVVSMIALHYIYGQQIKAVGEVYLGPVFTPVVNGGYHVGNVIYNQIFYERVDNSLINRKNRATADAMETWLHQLNNPHQECLHPSPFFSGP